MEKKNKRSERRSRDRNNREVSEFQDKVVDIKRVTKVVKGGRHLRFSALAIVGDGKGRVGAGKGKAAEIPDAIRKAIDRAKKNLITVPIKDTTIPHEIIGHDGAGKILLMPAPKGTGVIAGGPVRSICELAGIQDIRTKSLGSNNAMNMVNATMDGLRHLTTAEKVAKKRGKTVQEIFN